MFPGIIRRAVSMSQARHLERAKGARILRESSTLRAADDVWSDVASARGLGFRSDDAGPLLHGDLRSGGAFEMAISDSGEGAYTTLAAARLPAALTGRIAVRPHNAWTRAFGAIARPPAELPAELTSAFSVRAKPTSVASAVLTPKLQAMLQLLSDRFPELHAGGEEMLLVLEGVELAHERVEAIVDAFETLVTMSSGPYRQ